MQIIEKKFQNMLKEIFTSVPKYSILHKEKKNKYNRADQVVDMEAVNFVLLKHNKIFFCFESQKIKDFLFNNTS